MKRRQFIQHVSALSAVTLASGFGKSDETSSMFIGTPVLPEYLYENGIEKTLDQMQALSGINTVMTFSHDHVFNQYRPGFRPKTDAHGNEFTNVWVHTHEKYYADPQYLKNDNQGKYADKDILNDLYQATKSRGMNVYARILEPYVITGAIPGFEKMAEVDANAGKGRNVCFNHPDYRQYWDSVVEDLIRTHPFLDGFKYGQERGGPFLSSLGGGTATCFCEHCQKIAKARDIRIDQAREGMLALQKFGNAIRKENEKHADGKFVAFLRILAEYPDVLLWEKLWMDSREAQKVRMYKLIKSINPDVYVGWHIDHGMTWDLTTRTFWDYAQMGPYTDWVSVAVYFDSMGRRSLNHYKKFYQDILFGDAEKELSYPMYLSLLGYDPDKQPEPEVHEKQDTSFSADYVYQECKRAVERVNGSAKVYARPGFDMPGYDCNVQPEEVYAAVTRALDAGVDGLWVGREWDELKPENAKAAGKAIRRYRR